jgi:hypothetical protein
MAFGAPEAVYGVDFSASKDGAGTNTWITEIRAGGTRTRVAACECLADRLGVAPARDESLAALVEFVGELDGGAVGLDFPFSLPEAAFGELDANGWADFVEGFPAEWSGPEAFHRDVNSDLGGTERRETDGEHEGQCPYGWRIKTQTYYGIGTVLRGVRGDGVAVLPFEAPAEAGTAVLETYPAATLERIGANRTGYRGVRARNRRKRRENLDALERRLSLPERHRERAYFSEDAHDSIVAAYATYEAFRNGRVREGGNDLEGRIYA